MNGFQAVRTTSVEKDAKKENDVLEKNTKKKIIPVQSDSSESSPSPEEPSTPVGSHKPLSLSSRFNLQDEEEINKSLGQKLKNNYSKCHFALPV